MTLESSKSLVDENTYSPTPLSSPPDVGLPEELLIQDTGQGDENDEI